MTRNLLTVLATAAWLAVPERLPATTFVPIADEALVDRATLIVTGRIASALPTGAGGFPGTDYRLAVERVLAGSAPQGEVVVRVPGGRSTSGLVQRVVGAPAFAIGEPVLLLLVPAEDGAWRILQLMLGAFHRVAGGAGDADLALRDLGGARALAAPASLASPADGGRDFERFTAWIAERAAARERPADYFVPNAPGAPAAKYAFFHDPVHDLPLRWFEFDRAMPVLWYLSAQGQDGVPGGGFDELARALAAWSDEPRTALDLRFAGPTEIERGLCDGCFDGVNQVLTGDPLQQVGGSFDCRSGGILAFGGPYFDPADQVDFGGRAFVRILGADIVINDGVGCFFARAKSPSRTVEELFGHEIGHTLGLAHASDLPGERDSVLRDALMFFRLHGDGRGARLTVDDRLALAELYAGEILPDPRAPLGAPGDLVGTAVARRGVTLLWTDTATREQKYVIEMRSGEGPFTTIRTLPANRSTVTLGRLRAAPPWTFRVRARSARELGPPSNELTVSPP